MNNKNSSLPGYCLLVDRMLAEIAEKHGRDSKEVKQAILKNIEEPR